VERMRSVSWTTWLTCLASLACVASEDGPPPATDAAVAEAAPPEVPTGTPVVVLGSDIGDGFYAPDPPFAEVSRWLGLFEREDGWALEDVEIAWTTTPDSEPGEVPLQEMSTEPASPEILFGDVAGLEPGPIVTVAQHGAELRAPSSGASFALDGVRWAVRLEGSDKSGCDGVVTLSDGTTTQRLYGLAPGSDCGEPRFDVNWAGDLEGDGRLDLVATFSPKYSMHPRRLYLSSSADPGELVGLVALYDR
jgi:hypothetical protein